MGVRSKGYRVPVRARTDRRSLRTALTQDEATRLAMLPCPCPQDSTRSRSLCPRMFSAVYFRRASVNFGLQSPTVFLKGTRGYWEAIMSTTHPRSMPITNSTNWRASLNTGARPVRTLLNAFPNTCGIKPPLWPGCCPAVGWLSTCAYRPVTSTNTWPHGPKPATPRPHPLSRCRLPAGSSAAQAIEIDLERPDGARLHLRCPESTAPVAALVRAFLEGAR